MSGSSSAAAGGGGGGEMRFFDPERWAIVPASDYATGPSNGHACHTLPEAMKIFQAELPARLSNAMRRQRELEELKLFIAGTKSSAVLKQTAAVSAVQNEVATLVGLLREYESVMIKTIKTQCNDFQAGLGERNLIVEDTSKKIAKCISEMSTEDAVGNEAVANSLNPTAMETILSGMISADHLVAESASLFGNFPEELEFKIDRAKDSTLVCPKLVTLQVEKSELKGVPPLIITKDIVAPGSETGGDRSPEGGGGGGGGGDTGIRRLIQIPGSEHVQGLYPRTAFGQALTKRPFNLQEYHKLLQSGTIRTLGAQCGSVSANRTEYLNPLTEIPLKPNRDLFKVFVTCTATPASGKVTNLAQNLLHNAKEANSASGPGTKLDAFRTINQNFPILWFDFGPSTSVRVERYVLFHGHEEMHCAMRSWRVVGTNDMPFPPGISPSHQDETLLKIARESRAAVCARHEKATDNADAALPDNVGISVLDSRSREAVLGVTPFGGAMFECLGDGSSSSSSSSPISSSAAAAAAAGSNNSPPPSPTNHMYHHSSPQAKNQREFFRYVGIQVMAPGAGGGFHFELGGVEFFGTMMTMGGQN